MVSIDPIITLVGRSVFIEYFTYWQSVQIFTKPYRAMAFVCFFFLFASHAIRCIFLRLFGSINERMTCDLHHFFYSTFNIYWMCRRIWWLNTIYKSALTLRIFILHANILYLSSSVGMYMMIGQHLSWFTLHMNVSRKQTYLIN